MTYPSLSGLSLETISSTLLSWSGWRLGRVAVCLRSHQGAAYGQSKSKVVSPEYEALASCNTPGPVDLKSQAAAETIASHDGARIPFEIVET